MAEITRQEIIDRLKYYMFLAKQGCATIPDAGFTAAAIDLIKSIPEPEQKPPEYGRWIGWNGGECPVDDNALVDVVSNNNSRYSCISARPLRWEWQFGKDDIVAYRVHKPTPKTVSETWWMIVDSKTMCASKAEAEHILESLGGGRVIPVAVAYEVTE